MVQTQFVGLSNVTDYLMHCLICATLTGLIAAGLSVCAAHALSATRSTTKPTKQRTRRSAALRREAVRGITEIEEFLAAIPG
jgi:hypothetical protein